MQDIDNTFTTHVNTQERNLGQNKFPRKVLMVFFGRIMEYWNSFPKKISPGFFFKLLSNIPLFLSKKTDKMEGIRTKPCFKAVFEAER